MASSSSRKRREHTPSPFEGEGSSGSTQGKSHGVAERPTFPLRDPWYTPSLFFPVKYDSYSVALFEHENPSLNDRGMVSPSSQLSITPNLFEVVVADLSNLIVYLFPGISTIATSPRISSLNEHSSSPEKWANRSVMA